MSSKRKANKHGRKRQRSNYKGRASKQPVEVIRPEVVDELLSKLTSKENVSLTAEESRLLAGVLKTWAHVVERAQQSDFNVSKLRRLLGIIIQRQKGSGSGSGGDGGPNEGEGGGIKSTGDNGSAEESEKSEDTTETDEQSPQQETSKNRDEHGRRSFKDFPEADICHHTHKELISGCLCPECQRGKLYKYRPNQYMSISAQPIFKATRHIVDQLQCNLCDATFSAPLSKAAQMDGAFGKNLYTYSAVAIIAIYKFFGVMPWHRMEKLQTWIGVNIPDASMFDQCERLANIILPVVKYMLRLSANAPLFYGDDTGACVLNERSVIKACRKTGKPVERTGCHTTCVIAVTSDGHRIVHFRIGIQHMGEVMDQVLTFRDESLLAPMVMSDALSANNVTVCKVRKCLCNTHALRSFKELKDRYPDKSGYAITRYKKIYKNEDYCVKNELNDIDRLAFHREHSKPLLKQICTQGNDLLNIKKEIEPNSDLGKAYNYMLENEYELSAFYRYPGAPLDNNLSEQTLRLPVYLRNSAPFYRNGVGASIAAQILTIGVTAYNAGVNLLDYFVSMQRHSDDVKSRPYDWLPWCYKDRVSILERSGQISDSDNILGRGKEAHPIEDDKISSGTYLGVQSKDTGMQPLLC